MLQLRKSFASTEPPHTPLPGINETAVLELLPPAAWTEPQMRAVCRVIETTPKKNPRPSAPALRTQDDYPAARRRGLL
jgi:hypothetical protein